MLVQYGILDLKVRYGLEVRYFRFYYYYYFDIMVRRHFGGNCHAKLSMARILPIPGFRLFDGSINIMLTFEFRHDICTCILKMAIFDKVDNIEIKPALVWAELTLLFLDTMM